jgi:hypothetical protein
MVTLYGPTLVIVLAVIEVMVLGVLVGRGRVKYGVDAPATTGHPTLERLNRAHQNSIEHSSCSSRYSSPTASIPACRRACSSAWST